jgi:glucose/arabinose dehydrogenase
VNKVSRDRWNGSTLTFNKKILDLPATPGPNHSGGRLAFGPDNNLYVFSGDLNRRERTVNNAASQTVGTAGVVLRLTSAGKPVATNPFYSEANVGTPNEPLNSIYAYGIRNSFGMDFDPVSGDLWMSENGPDRFDEINRIRPGANSGWRTLIGPASRNTAGLTDTLVSLGDAAYYADPRFAWAKPVAPTEVFFNPNARLGAQYKNDLFVGDTKTGTIFNFNLPGSRKSLLLSGGLADGVADNTADPLAEQDSLIFGEGFGVVTDLFAGPGGMYVVSYGNGALYRITTAGSGPQGLRLASLSSVPIPEPGAAGCVVFAAALLVRRRRKRPASTDAVAMEGRLVSRPAWGRRNVRGRTAPL